MNFAFSKKGYDYLECLSTGSLIANPRPSRSDLSKFYKNRFRNIRTKTIKRINRVKNQ